MTTPKPPIDMELSDISDDDMMMMTDDPVDEVLPAARQELQVQFPREETMSIRKSSRESKRPRFHDESPVKVTKETVETSVGDIRASSQTTLPRRLPQRKELTTRPPSQRVKRKVRFGVDHRSPEHRTVGDLNVSTARRLICHAQLEHKTSVEDFPIGKLHFDCRKALQSKYGDLFKASIAKEMKAINEFKVMHPVTRDEIPANTKVFNSYMICHRKSLGHPDWKCKSRLIVDGSNTTPGVHTAEMDISTAMPRWNAVRLLLSVAKGKGWDIRSGDIHTAFLRGAASGITIYMRMPQGMREYITKGGRKVEVLQAVTGNLYGKSDSPRNVRIQNVYMTYTDTYALHTGDVINAT